MQKTPGYKKTRIGHVPIEWDVMKIKDVSKVNSRTLNNGVTEQYEFTYIDLSSVKKGRILFPSQKTLFANAPSRARRILQKNDVIMATVRPNLLGHAFADFEPQDIICSTGFALISADNLHDGRYIYHNIFSNHVNKQIHALIIGSNYPALNQKDVENILIPYPNSAKERQKIAKILSTWDEAISLTEKLIAAKEKLKKGLMQQLLTGKKRFKEFENSEWKTHKLSKLIELRHGYQFRTKDFVDSGVPVVKIRNVIGHNLNMTEADYVTSKRINEFKDVIIKNGDILMSLTGNIGRVIEVTGLSEPVFQNYRVGNFFPINDANLSKKFMKYVLQSTLLTNQLVKFSNQSAQANFGKQDMDKLKIDFPAAINEQKKIASVLSSCDKEIQLLNDKLEALKNQKKGFMRQLLTGKVRVKVKD